jgi:hypothetical protein
MNREASFNSMKTTNKMGAALLLGCALVASDLAVAGGQTGAVPVGAEQSAAPTRGASPSRPAAPARAAKDAQVSALRKQLEEVQAQLRELAQQNRALLEHQKTIDRQLQQQQEQLAQQAAAYNSSGANSALPGEAPTNSALPDSTSVLPNATPEGGTPLASFAQGVELWGYGEIYYTDPLHDRDRAQADLARAVFGIGYTFDSRTEFNSEYEIEHAVSSAEDPGEFEVEQFYIDHQIIDPVAVRAGLFLMPFGMLNEHHEPTNF